MIIIIKKEKIRVRLLCAREGTADMRYITWDESLALAVTPMMFHGT